MLSMKVNFTFLFLSRFRELQGGGLVVSTLADIRRGEEERREAAGVLAQVLSPWIEGNSSTEDIDSSLADIVISLKGELHSVYYSQFITGDYVCCTVGHCCCISALFGVITAHKNHNSISSVPFKLFLSRITITKMLFKITQFSCLCWTKNPTVLAQHVARC